MAQEAVPGRVDQPRGCAQRMGTVLAIAIAIYLALGFVTTLAFAFFGGAKMGAHALSEPLSYVVCIFWPVALVQYLMILLGL